MDTDDLDRILEDGSLDEPNSEAMFYGRINDEEGLYFVCETIVLGVSKDKKARSIFKNGLVSETVIDELFYDAKGKSINIFRYDQTVSADEMTEVAKEFRKAYFKHFLAQAEQRDEDLQKDRKEVMHIIEKKYVMPN